MSEQVIVVGGGGHAKVVIDCVQSAGDIVVGILDDNLPIGQKVIGHTVLGKTGDYIRYVEHKFLIAIGNNAVRRRIARTLPVNWHTAIHPRAAVSRYANIERGSVVMANAVVNAGTVVGRHCIINTGAIVEHDNRLLDYVHISPGVSLGGTVTVGEETHVGVGAAVKNNIEICGGCIIGAGAVVVKNITERGIYVGIPAHLK